MTKNEKLGPAGAMHGNAAELERLKGQLNQKAEDGTTTRSDGREGGADKAEREILARMEKRAQRRKDGVDDPPELEIPADVAARMEFNDEGWVHETVSVDLTRQELEAQFRPGGRIPFSGESEGTVVIEEVESPTGRGLLGGSHRLYRCRGVTDRGTPVKLRVSFYSGEELEVSPDTKADSAKVSFPRPQEQIGDEKNEAKEGQVSDKTESVKTPPTLPEQEVDRTKEKSSSETEEAGPRERIQRIEIEIKEVRRAIKKSERTLGTGQDNKTEQNKHKGFVDRLAYLQNTLQQLRDGFEETPDETASEETLPTPEATAQKQEVDEKKGRPKSTERQLKPKVAKKETADDGVRPKNETVELRQLLDYLNKARQNAREARNVYWHVVTTTPPDWTAPGFLQKRPDLAERFAYGMSKPYESEASAAHDLIDFLAQEAEGRIRELERPHRKEKEELRTLIAYLNKARQNAREVQDVYGYVLNTARAQGYNAPSFLHQRPDLAERFAYGINAPYKAESTAAHDLIDYLVEEAEKRLRRFEQSQQGTEEDEDKNGVSESEEGLSHLDSHEPVRDNEALVRRENTLPEHQRGEVIDAEYEVLDRKDTDESVSPEMSEQEKQAAAEARRQKLDEARELYIKARRIRTSFFRDKVLGRLLGRTLEFNGEKLTFGGKEGAQNLETLRKNYEEALQNEHDARLAEMIGVLDAKKAEGMGEAEYQGEMVKNLVALQREELEAMNAAVLDTKDQAWVARFSRKFRESWRRTATLRMVAGYALLGVGALTGPLGVSIALSGRQVLSGGGAYFGTEALLTKLGPLGHGGLVDTVSKRIRTMSSLAEQQEYLASIPPEKIKKEVARLRMLQIEKGVAFDDAGRSGSKTAGVAWMLFERDAELTAQSIAETANEQNETEQMLALMRERFANETDARNELSEKLGDTERLKKMGRKVVAATAGVGVGLLIGELAEGGSGGGGGEDAPGGVTQVTKEFSPEHVTSDLDVSSFAKSPSFEVTVGDGDNLWNIIESKLEGEGLLEQFTTEGERTHLIDALKDRFADMSPQELKDIGISSGDIDLLQPGETIDLSAAFNDDAFLAEWIGRTEGLSPDQIGAIEANNATLHEWVTNHPGEMLTTENAKAILDGTWQEAAADAATAPGDNVIFQEGFEGTAPDAAPDSVAGIASAGEKLSGAQLMERDLTRIFGNLDPRTSEYHQWKDMGARKFLRLDVPPESGAGRLQIYLKGTERAFRAPIGGFFRPNETVEEFIQKATEAISRRR